MFSFALWLSLNFSSFFPPTFLLSWSDQMFPQPLCLYKDMRKASPLGTITFNSSMFSLPSFTINWSLASCFQPSACAQADWGRRGWPLGCAVLSPVTNKKRMAICHFWMRHLIDVLFLSDISCLWQRLDIFEWLRFSWTAAACGSPLLAVLEISALIDCQITELALAELAEYLIFNSQWDTVSSESKDDFTKWAKRIAKIICVLRCFTFPNTLQKTFNSKLFVKSIFFNGPFLRPKLHCQLTRLTRKSPLGTI